MLLLRLPENKGGEDYTWISSLLMVRSNPLQSLGWLSSGKGLRLRTAGMQTLPCGPGGEHQPGGYLPGHWWHCLWPPPKGPMSQAEHGFLLALSQLSLPFTGGETEARGDLAHTS